MPFHRSRRLAAFIVFAFLIAASLACSVSSTATPTAQPTRPRASPQPTDTSRPANSPTPTPSPTPLAATVTPIATFTPTASSISASPTSTRTRAPIAATATPGSSVFRADKTQLPAGGCTTLRWDVDNVSAVFVNLGKGELPVGGHDTAEVCPDDSTQYTLRVVGQDGKSQQYTLRVTIAACGPTPVIARFEASELEVKSGESVTLYWDVACAQAVFIRDLSTQQARQPVAGHDEREFKPTQTTTYRLIVVAKDGSEIKQEITVKVVP